MEKESILNEKLNLTEWCQGLKSVPDDIWFQPFRTGSWGIADVISHFIVWDKFLMRSRLPYFISGESLPHVSIDVDEINKGAINYARSGGSKEEIINQFIFTRKRLVNFIKRIPDQNFNTYYQFGKESMKLNEYFSRLVQHDLRHKEEMLDFLEGKQIKLDK
ncbi:DinB family protein [Bacillus cereus]|uniref:DinB family protein n=1 Tax=Bacillus cereus TaxID=1396 RepID=UPI00357005C1